MGSSLCNMVSIPLCNMVSIPLCNMVSIPLCNMVSIPQCNMVSIPLCNLQASEVSEALSGVTQLKIGDVFLYICLDVRMSFCTLTLAYFRVSSVFDPVPNITNH